MTKGFARVGELDQHLWIDRRVETNVRGEVLVTWEPETMVWARIAPIGSREFYSAEVTEGKFDYRVIMRSRPSLTLKHRFRWGTKTLNIVGILGGGDREEYMQVMCEAGVTDGF